MIQQLRFAIRMLAKNPGFTTIAVLVLALGIGANAVMFTVTNNLLFRPRYGRQPEQLIGVYSRDKAPTPNYRSYSYPNYLDFQRRNSVFTDLMAFDVTMLGITEGDSTRRVFGSCVSANFFSTLGATLYQGRAFTLEEEKPESEIPVAIVSYMYWKRLGFDPQLLGKKIVVNGRSLTIVGITPKGFTGTTALFTSEVWLPLGLHEVVRNGFVQDNTKKLNDRNNHALMLVGRLKPGLTAPKAEVELKLLAAQLEKEYPLENKDQTCQLAELARLSITTNPKADDGLSVGAVLMMSISGVVLLIVCLNLANMLLARGAGRRKEIALRLALGATRSQIVRQLLLEGFVLSLLGGGVGLLLAYWVGSAFASALVPAIPFLCIEFPTAPDLRVVGATFGFCLVATLLSSLGPAWKLSRTEFFGDLKANASDGGSARSPLFGMRNLLVMGQIALSLALLTAGALFIRGALNASHADPGFSLDNSLVAEVDTGIVGYSEVRGRQTYQSLLEQLRAAPGIASVSMASMVPFGMYSDGRTVLSATAETTGNPSRGSGTLTNALATGNETRTNGKNTNAVYASYVIIANDYFRTLGVGLLRGREFNQLEVESDSVARVAIIDESLANRLWPGGDALGKRIRFEGGKGTQDPEVFEVVGVTGGMRQELYDQKPTPHVFVPYGRYFKPGMTLHIRLEPTSLAAQQAATQNVRAVIRAVDKNLALLSVQTFRQYLDDGILFWMARLSAKAFSALGLLALFLAVVGVYGVKSYVVARRTREIGIRMALGATGQSVMRLILKEGIKMTVIGLAVGLLLSLASGQILASMLYRVSPLDPVAMVVAPLMLCLAALVACYLPARRATRVNPIQALRYE
jgi:predicted permease